MVSVCGLVRSCYLCALIPSIDPLHSWVTGGTTIASAYSYVGGKSLTASGNKIRDTVQKVVQKEAMALRERARRRKRK